MGTSKVVSTKVISVDILAENEEPIRLLEGDEIIFWSNTCYSTAIRVEREGRLCLFGDGLKDCAGYVLTRETYRNNASTVRLNAGTTMKVISALTGFSFERRVDENEKQVFVALSKQ